MANRVISTAMATAFLVLHAFPTPASADNAMGYQLLTADQAKTLPRGGGKLGLNVGRAQQISSGGLTFELLRVNGVTSGSPGARAGFTTGDQIIAVDGKVFPSVATFAAYVGSKQPSDHVAIDYMGPQGGPKDAQRVDVTLSNLGQPAAQPADAKAGGLSTGTKIAIGVGAAALFGCYKLGCFSRSRTPAPAR